MKRIELWVPAAITAAAASAFYGPLGFGRDDLGAFLIGLLLLPALCFLAAVLGALLLFVRRGFAADVVRAALLATLAPVLFIPAWCFLDVPLRDPVRFAIWRVTHERELNAARRRDSLFMLWDEWGWAGDAGFAYLASDPTDALSRPGAVNGWANSHHLGCDIINVQRLDQGIYVLTTDECSINGVPAA